MGWRDRDYNRGGEAAREFLSNPASILGISIPFGTFPGLTIRLHFWLLLFFLFQAISALQSPLPRYYIPIDLASMLALLLVHEFGHRFFARRVGGNHWEFVLWPLGGMVPPQSPRTPWATFVANIGGIAFTLPIGLAAFAATLFLPQTVLVYHWTFNPFSPVILDAVHLGPANDLVLLELHLLGLTATFSAGIVVINLFPSYWFDGGNIWQSILWSKLGLYRATTITCLAGMILSVPFFLLSLWATNFFVIILWAMIFSGCYVKRRELLAAGPGVVGDHDDDGGYNYMDAPSYKPGRTRRRKSGWWARSASRKAAEERAEQAKIDVILAKVHDKGLHSLTWWEKRALRKATERQRKRDQELAKIEP